MTLYRGEVFKTFLIDRAAMGFDFAAIKGEFDQLYGIPLKEADYESLLATEDDAVRAREKELMDEMKSQNTFQQIRAIKDQLEEARDIALANQDLKTYASLTQASLKSIEVTLRGLEVLQKKDAATITLVQINNYGALGALARDGIITINKEPELKKLFGVKEEVVDVVPRAAPPDSSG